jgi:hypothetical protein|tara:strand:+ start:51 stop:221 length:171 start_codon:yes stop_codon:yes gene_type:complete
MIDADLCTFVNILRRQCVDGFRALLISLRRRCVDGYQFLPAAKERAMTSKNFKLKN